MGQRFTFRKKPALLRFFLAVVLILLLPLQATSADNEAKARQQIQQLDKEMASLRKLLAEFKAQRSDLQNALQKSEVAIGAVQKKIRSTQQQLKQQQAELQSLQGKRQQLDSAQQNQKKLIEQQVLAAYQLGQQKKIKVLLNQQQPDKIHRALTYYDYFNQARSEQINQYLNIISELNTLESRIVKKTETLTTARQKLDKARQSLLASQLSRQQNLAKINSAIKNNDQQLKQAAKDRAELERILAAVEQSLANLTIPGDYSPFGELKGKLSWPVAGKPSNRFGVKRNNSGLHWQGLAIPVAEGSKVQAIHSGRVVFADWLRGSGLLIIIDHGDGYMSLYAHNQSLLKAMGDWVNPGDIIATVGNSGGQQRAGLYFEIRHHGKPTDPRKWCKQV